MRKLWQQAAAPQTTAKYIKWSIVYPTLSYILLSICLASYLLLKVESDENTLLMAICLGLAFVHMLLIVYVLRLVFHARKYTSHLMRVVNMVVLSPTFLSIITLILEVLDPFSGIEKTLILTGLGLLSIFLGWSLILFCLLPKGYFINEWLFLPRIAYPDEREVTL